jgi:hypothetical protein
MSSESNSGYTSNEGSLACDSADPFPSVNEVCLYDVCLYDVCLYDVCLYDVCLYDVCLCAATSSVLLLALSVWLVDVYIV